MLVSENTQMTLSIWTMVIVLIALGKLIWNLRGYKWSLDNLKREFTNQKDYGTKRTNDYQLRLCVIETRLNKWDIKFVEFDKDLQYIKALLVKIDERQEKMLNN